MMFNLNTPKCCAPFSQILLQPTGRISPCCHLQGLSLGQVQDSKDVLNAWNHPKLKKLRREFLSGEIKTCKSRIQNIQCHLDFAHFEPDVAWEEVQQTSPMKLDVRLNGQCNLSCTMCDVWRQPNGVYDSSLFWLDGQTKIFPYLKEVDILGGEPFVQSDTFRLIEAIRQVNQFCVFNFVTNAHYRWTEKIANHVAALPIRYVQVSIDSLEPDIYALLRHGHIAMMMRCLSKWIELRDRRKDFELRASMVVVQQNWREVGNFIDFCLKKQLRPVLQMVYFDQSRQHSLLLLEKDGLAPVVKYLSELSMQFPNILQPILKPIGELFKKLNFEINRGLH